MSIVEYRVILPLTVEQYQVAQLWTVAEASKNETGGGEGIEILTNEPFTMQRHAPSPPLISSLGKYETGQFTDKIYHLGGKVPAFIRAIAPTGSLNVVETAWNAYPYCRTILTNPYMKENFSLKVETMHIQDKVSEENVHNLPPELLEKRHVVYIDIANDKLHSSGDYKAEWDPKLFQSKTTGIGPLIGPEWWKNTTMPIMCAYKLVTCEFKWRGLQSMTERFIQNVEHRIFLNFHRQLVCCIDQWQGYSMEEIRLLELKTKKDLEQQINDDERRGTQTN